MKYSNIYNSETKFWALTGPLGTVMNKYKQHILRGVFWTQSNFYDWAFLQQLLTAKSY